MGKHRPWHGTEGNEAQRQGSRCRGDTGEPFRTAREGCGIRELETRRRARFQGQWRQGLGSGDMEEQQGMAQC